MKKIRKLRHVFAALAVMGLAGAAWYGWQPIKETDSARFMGSSSCATCHPTQYAHWLESNHRHAMEPATRETVQGNFNDVTFPYFGKTTRFFRDGDSFRVTTENQHGQTETFAVTYTLGYKPLQQYLVDLGGGHVQALPFAWDSRPQKDGGQRWFHLYPKENITPDNPLFWTRPMQNWNHMCGDCHTTGFVKGFSEGNDRFDSLWSEGGNGCESCHGAGSSHVAARQAATAGAVADITMQRLTSPQAQIDQCGACHARRTRLRQTALHDRGIERMMETWRPQLPQESLYFVDGQIRDEVFEIGSFLQSKMAAKGVACADCHDPHTARLKAEGNALCIQCHDAPTFDAPAHHFHKSGTPGAQCVECHMPARTYMVIDPRRDHRFGIPRPDLSEALGTPNACVSCHRTQTNGWAAAALLKQRAGKGWAPAPNTLGSVSWTAIHEQEGAAQALRSFLSNAAASPIAKAAALASIRTLTPESLALLQSEPASKDPLVRLGALQALGRVPLQERVPLLADLARDPSRAIRVETAALLASADRSGLADSQRKTLDAAIAEYRQLLLHDADRAEALTALAGLQLAEGDAASARSSFDRALQRDNTSLITLLNYADFHRAQGNDDAAESLLAKAAALYPDAAGVHFALGLLRVRQKRAAEAIPELARAVELAPSDSNYAYVYAVGLYSTGQTNAALSLLEKARARFPANPQIQEALRTYCAAQRGRGFATAQVCSNR